MPGEPATDDVEPAAVLEAVMKTAGVVWLSPESAVAADQDRPGADPVPWTTGPVWHVWSEGACYLLTGPGEQPLPGIVAGSRCQVTARNAAGGRVITWEATVEALDPSGRQWSAVAPKLAAARLNGGDPMLVVPTWPGRLTILCLRPTGDQASARTGLPDDSLAAAPLPTPATTPYRMPSDITRRWWRRRIRNRNKS
ncbi:MAG: hypothetical protein M3313_06200 [Actinomycetota bacterium]|nr:hypothetical protein [Actinomycetota bacterium]